MGTSLYSLLMNQHAADVVPMRCSQATLSRLTHHFEDLVVENNLAALVVQGRCLDGDPETQVRRFQRLSRATGRHYLFTCREDCRQRTWTAPAGAAGVFEQADFHKVDTGPFILVFDQHFAGLLASERSADEDDPDSYGMVWTFDPNVAYTALEYFIARVTAQHGDGEADFVRALRASGTSTASLRLTLNLTTRIAVLLQKQTELETAISRVSSLVNSTFETESVLPTALDHVVRALEARRVELALDESGDERSYESARPPRLTALASGRLLLPPPPLEVSVKFHGHTFGVLRVEDSTPGRIWEVEERRTVETIARHIAVGLSNSRLFRQLGEQAITDELTGIYNRRYYQDRFRRELAFADRSGRPVSLLRLDIDDFKHVNDRCGHAAGDTVLRFLGKLLSSVVRNIDVCARVAGEEFAVILPDTDLAEAVLVAERIRDSVERAEFPDVGRVTISVGASTYPSSAASGDELMRGADRALSRAKEAGRNRVLADEAAGAAVPNEDDHP